MFSAKKSFTKQISGKKLFYQSFLLGKFLFYQHFFSAPYFSSNFFGIRDFEFGTLDSGFRIWDLGFAIEDLGLGTQDLGHRLILFMTHFSLPISRQINKLAQSYLTQLN